MEKESEIFEPHMEEESNILEPHMKKHNNDSKADWDNKNDPFRPVSACATYPIPR